MKKSINLISIIVTSLIILLILSIIFFFAYKTLKEDVKGKQDITIYASVLESGKNYIKIKDENTDDVYYLNYDKNDLTSGEVIAITYKDKIDNYKKIDVIVDSEEDIIIIDSVSNSPTTNEVTSKEIVIPSDAKVTTQAIVTDDEIIKGFEASYMSIDGNKDASISENIKTKFIEIVDFIFYGTEIKGRTFASLSESAKSKVLYYALLMDQSIDNKWPDYKDNISSKYQDTKAKLLAKYLDVSADICGKNDNERYCEYVKSDFKVLKYSLNLTWDTIKKAFKFGYDKTTESIVKWYEMFSGKV